MERWKRSTLAGIVLCAGLLTGCGGESSGMPEGDIVSGEAVSSEAIRKKPVSGEAIRANSANDETIRKEAVSGPAIKDGEEKSQNKEKQNAGSHRFCTDTNLYYVNEGEIMQAWVDGTHRKCIWKCKGAEDEIELLYVDTDWLYYNISFSDEDYMITYRAPVKRDKKRHDEVRFSEKEQLVKSELMYSIYVDTDYYFYLDRDADKFIKYDLKRKKKVSEQTAYVWGEIFRGKDHYFYMNDGELYVQKTDSAQWKKVSDVIDNGSFPVSNGRELFYPSYIKKGKGEVRFDIWGYDGKQKREFVTWEQLIQTMEEVTGTQNMDVCMLDQLFWQEDRLYIQLQAGWADGEIYHMEYMMFSRGRNGSGLRYEKELTEGMKSHVRERSGKWTDDHTVDEIVYVEHMTANDAQCIAMADGKAYLSLYDYENEKGRLGCYDLKSGKFGWVSKTDNTFYKLGYDQDINDFKTVFNDREDDNDFAGEWDWPPSKDKGCMGDFVEG